MDFFRRLIVVVYFLFYLVIGGSLLVLSLAFLPTEKILEYMRYAYNDPNIKLGLGIAGIIILLIGVITTKISLGKLQREKTIAFDNADGQVIVSLAAIEDYVRRAVKFLPQVKDLKSTVTAGKKGITVVSRATLFSDSNIPEVTEKIQGLVKHKLIEMLAIAETISIRVHVVRLVNRPVKEEVEPKREKEVLNPVPYRDDLD
ncbi:MAG: alkaline shock response membrane anchor protein AmaP [Candidatus Omnitrophica bacterium]|nr:alkaline shock response membrane anchor protein AmaP [Candidatus Omnitrophota bacterium]